MVRIIRNRSGKTRTYKMVLLPLRVLLGYFPPTLRHILRKFKLTGRELQNGTTVEITGNVFKGGDPAVSIETKEKVTKTIVTELK